MTSVISGLELEKKNGGLAKLTVGHLSAELNALVCYGPLNLVIYLA